METSQKNKNDLRNRRFTQYTVPIYHYCHRLIGNEEVAKDVAQDTLIQAILYSQIPDDHFKSYLYKIAKCKCIDWFRRHKRQNTLNLEEKAESFGKEDPDMNRVFWKTLGEQLILPCLDKLRIKELGEEQCTFFLLYFLEDLTYAKISEQTGYTENQVRYQISKAKQFLKRCLMQQGIETP